MDNLNYTACFINILQKKKKLPTHSNHLRNEKYKQYIIALSEIDKLKDGVIKIEIAKEGLYNVTTTNNNTYIAVGYVVRKIYKCKGIPNDWPKSDIDIYNLNYDSMYRYSFEDDLDFIHCPDKDIDSLLLRFDLPICRAGMEIFIYTLLLSRL
jgi:hypothetical protein